MEQSELAPSQRKRLSIRRCLRLRYRETHYFWTEASDDDLSRQYLDPIPSKSNIEIHDNEPTPRG